MTFSKGEPVPPEDLDELANKLTAYDKRKFKTALLTDEDVPQALTNTTKYILQKPNLMIKLTTADYWILTWSSAFTFTFSYLRYLKYLFSEVSSIIISSR